MSTETGRDYYEILGVDPKASQAEIKSAYRQWMKSNHPDEFTRAKQDYLNKGGSDATILRGMDELHAERTERAKTVNEAYDVLSDPYKRDRYDRTRQHVGTSTTPPRIVVEPPSCNFGTLSRGQQRSVSFHLRNDGGLVTSASVNWDKPAPWASLNVYNTATPGPFPANIELTIDTDLADSGAITNAILIITDGHITTIPVLFEVAPVTTANVSSPYNLGGTVRRPFSQHEPRIAGRRRAWLIVLLLSMAVGFFGIIMDSLYYTNPAPAERATGTDQPLTDPRANNLGRSANDRIALHIVNDTASTVCYLYVSPSTDTEWGYNKLGTGMVIEPGGYHKLTDITAGPYDMRADDCDGNTLTQEFGISLMSTEGYTWTLRDQHVALTVINNSSIDICYLYVSASTDEEWGPDQLGSETILSAGQSFSVEGIDPGSYDMRIEGCTEGELEEYGLDLSTDFEYTVTD